MKTERVNGLISIIIPIYNVEAYLDNCIASVLRQTYDKIEVILIDDGSTDTSGGKCDAWEKTDARITVIHQNNKGLSAARNIGIDTSQGQYIMYVDGDDYVSEQICETMIKAIHETEAECCVCGRCDVDMTGNVLRTYQVPQKEYISGKNVLQKLYIDKDNRFNIVVAWGKLYHWKVWEKLRYTEGIYYEDLDIMPYLYSECSKIVGIPHIGYYYVQRNGSISKGIGINDKRYIDSKNIRMKHIEYYEKNEEDMLAHLQIERLLDLIIESDSNGWIPQKENTRELFVKYLNKYVFHSAFKISNIHGRYIIYFLFGEKVYSSLRNMKKVLKTKEKRNE